MRGVVALALAATASVCCSAVNPTGPSPVSATERLVEALQAQGVTVTRGEALPRSSNPFFSVPARVLVVNGGNVTVFEYASDAAAVADAARVSPSGCFVGSTMITWIAPPSFYRQGPLIAIHAGTAESVLRPLTRVLGEPFARC